MAGDLIRHALPPGRCRLEPASNVGPKPSLAALLASAEIAVSNGLAEAIPQLLRRSMDVALSLAEASFEAAHQTEEGA